MSTSWLGTGWALSGAQKEIASHTSRQLVRIIISQGMVLGRFLAVNKMLIKKYLPVLYLGPSYLARVFACTQKDAIGQALWFIGCRNKPGGKIRILHVFIQRKHGPLDAAVREPFQVLIHAPGG